MKKILFLLLFTIVGYGQTYQNPTYGTVTTKTAPTSTTPPTMATIESTGTIGKIAPENIPVNISPQPINYSITDTKLGSHLKGIDNKFGSFVQTTAGITNRIFFTGDLTTVTAGTFFTSSATGKGSVASASPTPIVNNDNEKKYFDQDIIGVAFPALTKFPAGTYAGNLSVRVSPNSAQQRYTVEIYKTDNGGTPIASGVAGAVVGSLGVTVVTIIDSGLINLADNSVTSIPVSGVLGGELTINTGERIRYHVSGEKVGTASATITMEVFYGNSYNSYYDVPVTFNTNSVLNVSTVTGATTTDALNDLNGRVNSSASGSLIGYFYNTASDIATYKNLINEPSTGGLQTVSTACPTTTTTLVSFATLLGSPNRTSIPTGNTTVNFNAFRSAGSKAVSVKAEIYKRASGGTEALLFTTSETPLLTGSTFAYDVEYLITAPIVLLATDRIVVKMVATTSGGGSTPTVAFEMEGTLYSRITLPQASLGYTPENIANKQNSLTVDGSGVKYPTVDAVNVGLGLKEGVTREKTIFSTNFQSTSDLSVSGAFTIVSGGLKSPSTGTFGNTYAIWDKKIVIDKDVTRAIVTVTNTSSVFGLIRKPSVTIEAGVKANINGATNTITIYNGWDGSNTALASSVSATIPFSLVSGKKYLLELEKLSSGTKSFSITDISNQETIKITSNNEVNSFSGSCWDAPGVSFEGGDVTFNNLTYGSVYNPKPLVMISGDSFVEGNSLVDFGLGAYDKRWAYLMYGALQNDAVLSGRGGESSAGMLLRDDFDFFKPKYHLFLTGANDVDFNVWKTNYDSFIAKVLANGSIPVLATIAPRADRQSYINQANAYIKTLPYKVINFAKAISLNNDEITLNPTYYTPDNVHPNILGHSLMFNQVKIDFPVLFDKKYELHDAVVKGRLTVTSLIDPGVRTVVVENGILTSVENGITGSGATNFLSKIISKGVIGSALVFDDGTNVGVGTSNPITKFNIDKGGQNYSSTTPTGGLLITDAIVGGTQRSIELGTDTTNGIGYLQARSSLSSTWYNLALNPNGGRVLFNTTTDNEADQVQVNGTVLSTQYKISALNASPATATSTGTLGEIRVTATHIYVCTATNTWVRSALTTW